MFYSSILLLFAPCFVDEYSHDSLPLKMRKVRLQSQSATRVNVQSDRQKIARLSILPFCRAAPRVCSYSSQTSAPPHHESPANVENLVVGKRSTVLRVYPQLHAGRSELRRSKATVIGGTLKNANLLSVCAGETLRSLLPSGLFPSGWCSSSLSATPLFQQMPRSAKQVIAAPRATSLAPKRPFLLQIGGK
jgi:hypothetical protein